MAALALGPLGQAMGASSAMAVRLESGGLQVSTIWGQILPAMANLQTGSVPLEGATLLVRCAQTDESGECSDSTVARGGLSELPPAGLRSGTHSGARVRRS